MGSVGPYPSIRAEALYARLRSIAARVCLDGEPSVFSRRLDDMVMGRRVRFASGLDKGDRLLWWDAQRALAFLDELAPKPAAALRGRLYPGRRFRPRWWRMMEEACRRNLWGYALELLLWAMEREGEVPAEPPCCAPTDFALYVMLRRRLRP
jgi:hypothetical protein